MQQVGTALVDLFSHAGETLAELERLSWADLTFLHRDGAVLTIGLLLAVSLAGLLLRYARASRPGRTAVVLASLLPARRRSHLAPLRHAAFATFLLGLPFFFVALADPHTRLVQEQTSYPGHRIAILLDASMSMNTAFATKRFGSGNLFMANVAAAEYFVRRRMESPHRDLVALVVFGNEAYVLTPFTSDYENILLSISLMGTPEEYKRFPDHGTIIMKAMNQGVQLFRTFDFLKATGNLIVVFSDGQDTHVRFEGLALDDVLEAAAENRVPVYFIRTSYERELGDLVPDQLWRQAVEKTGGRFYPAANEDAILEAIHEIDRLAEGRIDLKQYVAHEPRFSPFALVAIAFWTLALVLTLGVKQLRRFP